MMTQKLTAQKGFTLIELMISLTLGLIVIAAAVGIYIANYKTLATQKSSSEMQSASMLGIQPLESRLRLANLSDNTGKTKGDTGIILVNAADSAVISKTGSGRSNTNKKSDQLVVQFTNATEFSMYDCEGAEVARNAKTTERYYLDDNNGELSLMCDAGVTGGAVPLITGVDQFRFLLGTQRISDGSNSSTKGEILTQFMTVDKYKAELGSVPDPKYTPYIVSVRVGVIARGTTPISTSDGLSEFTLLGEKETLNPSISKKIVRNTFETTTLLRNARVISYAASFVDVEIK